MAHKKVLKCRVKKHPRKPAVGKATKPMPAKGKAVSEKLRSKHRAHKPRSAKNKKHERRQKAAGNTPRACQASAPAPKAGP